MNQQYGLPFYNLLKEKEELMNNYQMTYSYRLASLCKEKGYIKAHMELAEKTQKRSFLRTFQVKTLYRYGTFHSNTFERKY